MFGVEPNGHLRVANNGRKTEPRAGWSVIALVPPVQDAGVSVAVA